MRSQEPKVSPRSDYYVYAPSALARKIYLYPLSVGHFIYEPDYSISRKSFDSFLVMYIVKGTVDVCFNEKKFRAKAGEFVLLDCYLPHRYGSGSAWEAVWLHFDGVLAREYYSEISSHFGNVISPANGEELFHSLETICGLFRSYDPIVESVLSGGITHILDGLLSPGRENRSTNSYTDMTAGAVAFINEHFSQDLSLRDMADKMNVSPYHFTRIFARETGFTPYQYLINTRISAAKFLLKSTDFSVKDIGFSTGFHSESSFCSAFKKWAGVTPTHYRKDTHI